MTGPKDRAHNGSRRRSADAHQYEHHGVQRLPQPRHHQRQLGKSLEKLSSGYRINRAADDASGLVISQNLRQAGLGSPQATQNAQDGISVVQTAEGALTAGPLDAPAHPRPDRPVGQHRVVGLDRRTAAQNEIVQLRDEIDRIGNTTSFGNQKLLDGSFGAQEASVSATTATGLTSGVTVGRRPPTCSFTLEHRRGQHRGGFGHGRVSVNAGTYATAASFQAELQTDIDAATTGSRRLHRRASRVKVTDLGWRRLDRRVQAQQHRVRHTASRSRASARTSPAHSRPAERRRSRTPAAACSRSVPT